jgi:hypothetical protein
MILFYDEAQGIKVIRTTNGTVGESDNLGVLTMEFDRYDNDRWIWDFSTASYLQSWVGFETLDRPEKQQIIGMLDKLNRIIYRKLGSTQARWVEITGLPEATF